METNNIYVHVKGLGFTFLLDKRMKHNLISPTFLAFFKTDKQRNSLLNNGIGAVSTKPEYNNSLPFLPAYVDSISLKDIFHYVGKKIVWWYLVDKLFPAVIAGRYYPVCYDYIVQLYHAAGGNQCK